jgi:hypothetical protein
MDNVLKSQFDEFLNFSDLFLLQISFRGDLVSFRPRGKQFWGWSFEKRLQFNFVEHFLKPNHITLDLFLRFIEDKDYAVEYFVWKSPDGKVSSPYLVFFRPNEEVKSKDILIFIKNQVSQVENDILIEDKKYVYQSKYLPGFIHNLNGPLSTILGRIELLQLKHPTIEEFKEIVSVGYQLQSIMDNLSFKIQNETTSEITKVNLNRLLREELKFMNCDLFFKHNVEKIEDLSNNIPEFNVDYFTISGVLSESYQFLRQFIDEQKEYVFKLKSYANGSTIGFKIDFSGDFKSPGDKGAALPVLFEGGAIEVARTAPQGLDKGFLAKCMEINHGHLCLKCEKDNMRVDFNLSLTEN